MSHGPAYPPLAGGLRRYDMQAGQLYVGLRLEVPPDNIGQLFMVPYGLPDGGGMFELARKFLRRRWRGVMVSAG